MVKSFELKLSAILLRSLSDLYVTCQLIADNKPLSIAYRTAFKSFKNNYMYDHNPYTFLPQLEKLRLIQME